MDVEISRIAGEFSAVLFDFDGVLVDTEWVIYDAWQRFFSNHGHPLPLAIYTQCIGTDFGTWSPKTHIEELTGLGFDWEKIDRHRQQQIVTGLANEGPMPGVLAALTSLEKANIRRAVVSSSSHDWVDGWLKKIGISHYFAHIICREDAPRVKPAPDLYLEAARRLGLPGEKCLVIEDSLNGVRAAKAAHMTVWAVPNRVTAGLDFAEADRSLNSLAELQAQP